MSVRIGSGRRTKVSAVGTVLVLGAGMVARPLVRYLLDLGGVRVIVADLDVERAQRLITDHPRGEARSLDAEDRGAMVSLVKDADVVVSILPPAYLQRVAELCVENGKHMVCTSYVDDALRALDAPAREAGVLILTELGLDPGIDHMSAISMIAREQEAGFKIVGFRSLCGALPAPAAADNPFRYKFSWNPRGVLTASKRPARYLENGQYVVIPGETLFEHYQLMEVENTGSFEYYPNHDAMCYRDIYGLGDVRTLYRGTLRYKGWCDTMKAIGRLGWLDEHHLEGVHGLRYMDVTAQLIGAPAGADLTQRVAERLGLASTSPVIARLSWLGILGDVIVPEGAETPLDALCALMVGRLAYSEGERDMVIMRHEIEVEHEGTCERVVATLVQHGGPGGDTAIARTVGLPAAIGVRLLLEGRLDLKGVHIPVTPEVYVPVLAELDGLGIRFTEHRQEL
ncbi:MAG: saccharopine dehydrogenase C-terminal domain-containing protein [Candidatus Undinarchaeales archaeon]|nr:saccharopine dehydrogenase C-terminal domain-containing protein [Candidatus Undinarchaeales archaeon]